MIQTFLIQILLAGILGGIIGSERALVGKAAGMRTFSLVTIGSTLFTILSLHGFSGSGVDASRVAAQVVVGIGFLGAGVIIQEGIRVRGLTTAAGLWASAAVGMAVGLSMYIIAIMTTAIVFFVLFVLGKWDVEDKIRKLRE